MTLQINHDKERHRFTAEVEGKISELKYTTSPDGKTLNYQHTFVPPELRGRRIAEQIVKEAMEYAKNNNYKVIPSCPYVHAYVERHPEYREVVISPK